MAITQSSNTITEAAPGVWLIQFPVREQVTGEHCAHLVPPLIEASKQGPIVLLANPTSDLNVVHPSMSMFWLEAFTKRGVHLSGVGIVTRSISVKAVMSAVGLALSVRDNPILTRTFVNVRDAIEWGARIAAPREHTSPNRARVTAL